MSMKDKAREKLMSSMRKTKDSIKDDAVENKTVTSADQTPKAATKPADTSSVKVTPKEAPQKSVQETVKETSKESPKETPQKKSVKPDNQVKKDKSSTIKFNSTRVWPD